MQMMYNIIAQEIKAMNLKDIHPQDYLNFYCLGNREPPVDLTDSGQQISKSNGDGVTLLALKTLMFFSDDPWC